MPEGRIDALLGAFAAATLSPALHALVAAHLMLCGRNRAFVAALERMQGTHLQSCEPVPMPGREARLAAVFAAQPTPGPRRASAGFFPAPLRQYVGRDLADITWRSLLPGIREFRIAGEADGEACIYWIKAGRKMPFHTHAGSEATLVLQGAFHDSFGHYRRGDVAVADSDVDHQPIADPQGDCICFAVTDAPLRLTGPVGRIVERLFGHKH